MRTAKFSSDFNGGNDDSYTGSGHIWEIAKRFNDQSILMNGHVTVVRRRQVTKTRRVGVL